MLKKKGFEKLEMEMFVFGWDVLSYVKPDNLDNPKDNPLTDIYNEHLLVETIKKKQPTLNELVLFLQQEGYDQEKMLKLVSLWDVLNYVKKDKEFINMTKKYKTLKNKKAKTQFLNNLYQKLSKKTTVRKMTQKNKRHKKTNDTKKD